MDSCEAVVDIVEAPRSTVEQRKRIYFPMNLISNGARSLCLRGGDSASTRDTESLHESLTNLRFSEIYNIPGESVAMSPEIFSEMRDGNKKFLDKLRHYKTPMVCYKTDKGDTVLHLAASLGHLELVKSIVSECPALLLEFNWKARLPLHVAARAGHSAVVEALVVAVTCFAARLSEEDRERLNLFVLKDINGDTPLHLALKDLHEKTELLMYQKRFRYQPSMFPRLRTVSFSDASRLLMETACFLVKAKQRASLVANKDGISPLYMAVKAGNVSLVSEMLKRPRNIIQGQTSNLASRLEGRKSLVHAALISKDKDVLNVILEEDPSLVNERDEQGRTCLSVGASVGCYKGVCKILERSTSNVFECDDDGSFPIHMAMEKGHRRIVKEILKRCPASKMLLNKHGQNILHIAAKSGKARPFLPDIRKLDADNYLIQEQDVDGNTPLHLATIMWRPRTVSYITIVASNKTRILNIQNKQGLRPLDIAESNLQSDYVLRERLTLMVLLCVYKPRGVGWLPTSGMTLRSRSEHLDATKYKDSINALLLVATLVATVAFAAGFTMPGGFNNLGMSILANDSTLSYFLFFDTVAMQSSVVAIVALIWAQLGDPELIHGAFHLALPSLFVALFSMASAFLSGVLATIKQNKELGNVIIVISSVFYFVVFCLLAPYVIPQVLGIRVLQQLTDVYLGLLVWFVNEDDDTHTRANKVKPVKSSSENQVEKSKFL